MWEGRSFGSVEGQKHLVCTLGVAVCLCPFEEELVRFHAGVSLDSSHLVLENRCSAVQEVCGSRSSRG